MITLSVMEILSTVEKMRIQVRLRLVSASICHTDLWVWKGEDRGMMAPFPMILGHEGVKTVLFPTRPPLQGQGKLRPLVKE